MQWLIDLIIESIGVPPTYIDRGDPPIPDFDKFDFTPDDSWHELDLSAIVPAGATAVALSVIFLNTIVSKTIDLREAGNIGGYNVSRNRTYVANIPHVNDNIVAVDEDRKIEYYLSTAGWITIGVTVKGWWL